MKVFVFTNSYQRYLDYCKQNNLNPFTEARMANRLSDLLGHDRDQPIIKLMPNGDWDDYTHDAHSNLMKFGYHFKDYWT